MIAEHPKALPPVPICPLRSRLALLFVACIAIPIAAANRASAQPRGPMPKSDEPQYSPWQSKHHSWMAQFATVFGIVYARPRATIGYGAPFWQFVGIDAWLLTNTTFAAAYIGWRANLPWLDVQIGGRKVYPYNRRLLPRRVSHGTGELAIGEGDVRSEYHAIDFETLITLPLLHGGVFNANQAVWVDAPRNRHLYEESLRVVMQPPFMLGTRTGYVYGFGESQDLKTGIMVEWLITPDRAKNAVRVGPLALYSFGKHLEAQFVFSPAVYGPDDLGLFHGTYALLGLQHRFAVRFEPTNTP